MSVKMVFETHALSEDNERGIATGWLQGHLSDRGREQAKQLGERRRSDGLSAVFTSDLRRSLETAHIAFGDSEIPVFADWRLRECNYGRLNGAEASLVHGQMRLAHLSIPYPNGESWIQAIQRVIRALAEIACDWNERGVLVIGHKATGWALRHALEKIEIAELLLDDVSVPRGREYVIDDPSELWSALPTSHRGLPDGSST